MKTPSILGLLFRSLLLALFSSLVACSSVLQATRLNRPFLHQSSETIDTVPPESINGKLLFTNDAQPLYFEVIYPSSNPMAPGYQWVFVVKQGAHNNLNTGYWQIKPIN